MKTKIIYISLILLFISNCYSQSLKGVYTIQALKGIGDSEKLSSTAKKPLYFSYIHAKNKSLQELIDGGGVFVDSLYNDYDEAPGEKFVSKIVTISPDKAFVYKDFTSSTYKVFFDQDKKQTYIIDSLPNYQWSLVNESKTIAGYKCKKATTRKNIMNRHQNITAWYCEEIAINDGPKDFNGLPGFIIQIEINDTTLIKFEKLKIITNETLEITPPELKIEPITIKVYEENALNGK